MPVEMTVTHRSSGYVAQVLRPQVEQHFNPRVHQALAFAKANAPVDKQGGGGALRRSIRLYARGAGGRFASQSPGKTPICSYEISVEVPYASHVIRGTKPHRIVAHGPWSLHNPKTGAYFGPAVRHPGIRANDFLTRSMKQAGLA